MADEDVVVPPETVNEDVVPTETVTETVPVNKTASGIFQYDQVFNGKTLDAWAREVVDKLLAIDPPEESYHYIFKRFRPFTYDYDSMIHMVGGLLGPFPNHNHNSSPIEPMYQGWRTNYLYWNEKVPYAYDATYEAPHIRIDHPIRKVVFADTFEQIPHDCKWFFELIYKQIGITL